jgi:hypothetical protein
VFTGRYEATISFSSGNMFSGNYLSDYKGQVRPGFDSGSGQVGFVVDKVALRQVFSEYFGFPC